MHKELASHHDFKHDMNLNELLLRQKGYICVFVPKFHPEINPIERIWAQLKKITKGHCKYTSLPKKQMAYGTVTLENILKHFRRVRHYMYAYLEGLNPGAEVDEAIK